MILVIDTNKKRRDTLLEIFHYMGILSYGTEPSRAYSEISSDYRAILISEPLSLPDAESYISKLRKYSAKIPIFTISEDALPNEIIREVAMTFEADVYSSDLINDMINYMDERSLPSLGKYLLAGLDAGCDIGEVRYMSEKLNFTKTETMIMRYLILTYPNTKSAEEILAHTEKPGKNSDVSVIRTHISSINKKFRSRRGRNIIFQSPKEGYQIATPELAKTH